jgi:flagellar basal body P-ring protein FlgI
MMSAYLQGRRQPRNAGCPDQRNADRGAAICRSLDGVTAVEPLTDITAGVDGGQVAIIDGPDLRTLVAGLNSIGVKPDGIIAILQGIKSAGALHAELVLQ